MKGFLVGLMVGVLLGSVVTWAQTWPPQSPMLLYPVTPPTTLTPRDYSLPPLDYAGDHLTVPPFLLREPC